ncbi:cytochrome P450 [Streptomyces sp. NPDC048290]|uniref:cytochrome P450 n=1 Tax=Streptomyces sp. NPDC048290 TaxID=3155811 RepID=UPI0034321F98
MTARPHRLPPMAPGRLPLLGHAVPLLRDRLAFLQQLRHHGPAVRIAAGPRTLTVVNSHDLIHEMLTRQADSFSKGFLFERLKLFGSDALPVAEGPRHLARRRLLQPAFHREQVHSYVATMRDTAQPLIGAWHDGQTLDLKTRMQLITQNTVMAVTLTARPGPAHARAVLDSVDTVFKAALRRALLPLPLLERLPTRRNRTTTTAQRVLRTTVTGIIAAHRAEPDAHHDVISLLLAARDDNGAALSDDDILSEVTGLLAAGSETTAVVLAWLFHTLAHHPRHEAALHTEVDTVLGEGPLTAAHLPRLNVTRRLITETLRLYSPAWLVTRHTLRPVHLGPAWLPAGTDIVFSPYTLHRDPHLYPDPLAFDPDRWLPDRPQPPKAAFIPFGAGKRQCMGDAFAMTEALVVTALIASRWRLRPSPGTPVRPAGEITVHPYGLHMTAHARTGPAVTRRTR